MMYRQPEEIAALRESYRKMSVAEKVEYIYTYYKWFFILGLIALVIAGNTLHRQLTKKEPVLYLGLANVAVGTELEDTLTQGYLDYADINSKKNEVLVYTGLYLSKDPTTENHQYAYASRMKIMAAVTAQKLDVVLMNREAYDYLSQDGYLLPLTELPESLMPYRMENEVVLESNAIDVQLNTATEYHIVTETVPNGLDVSTFPLFQNAGFDGAVYMGFIANTGHFDTDISYLEYLNTVQ